MTFFLFVNESANKFTDEKQTKLMIFLTSNQCKLNN